MNRRTFCKTMAVAPLAPAVIAQCTPPLAPAVLTQSAGPSLSFGLFEEFPPLGPEMLKRLSEASVEKP